jgi:3,4-dihydroxy 2-butanone 4-phosphate synthase/GTP cyclohydrolase II
MELALEVLKQGKAIVVVDDFDRENEGDLVLSAERVTKEDLVFAMNDAGGLMCLPCSGDILDKLKIPQMVSNSNDPLETPFTVSIDHVETSTGMSADDRLKTIALLTDENTTPDQVQMPGHLFPLRARKNLLKERRGHTEASIQLMNLCGLREVGSMMKGQELNAFCAKHDLLLVSIEEIYDEAYNKGV